jgi:pimeloyl-ACP methyl ester carboxylesterase
MTIVDCGSGPPVVLVPGVQGRWEWLRPGVDALARDCRVVTFSLADEPTAGSRFDETNGFCSYVDQIAEAMDHAGLQRATICGVSYGGLIAAAFAARHPDRTVALVLASAIPASWRPDARIRFYLRAPVLLSPLFCLASVRMYPEFAAAAGGTFRGLRLAATHGWTALQHMFSPARMARRVHLLEPGTLRGTGLLQELAGVHVPTLIITGEEHLDRVVPVGMTRQYLTLWPHARIETIARSGHLGVITRPAEFARLITSFVHESARLTGGPHIQNEVRRVV